MNRFQRNQNALAASGVDQGKNHAAAFPPRDYWNVSGSRGGRRHHRASLCRRWMLCALRSRGELSKSLPSRLRRQKITTTCWGFKSEDFCVPGPSQRGCTHCETVCDECLGPKGPCVQPQKLVWTEWMPGSTAKVYTKKKLMKRTVTKTVPSYRWVVEDVCSQCQTESAAGL